jgi:hypothetical protein
MNLKRSITDALLPVLREYCPKCSADDPGFFGSRADIAVPLGVKYGLDMDERMVYNIKNGVSMDGFPLFSSARMSSGFLELRIRDEALCRFARGTVSRADAAAFLPPDEFELFKGLGFIRARLLDLFRQRGGDITVPVSPEARRALWHCLTADSPSSLNVALKEAGEAAERGRLDGLNGNGAFELSGGAALAMAVSLYEASRTITIRME